MSGGLLIDCYCVIEDSFNLMLVIGIIYAFPVLVCPYVYQLIVRRSFPELTGANRIDKLMELPVILFNRNARMTEIMQLCNEGRMKDFWNHEHPL